MGLTRTREEFREAVRYSADAQGRTARHEDDDINNLISVGIAALFRKLTAGVPSQRYLATASIAMEEGVTAYPLPAEFRMLISAEVNGNSSRTWLDSFERTKRPALSDAQAGRPCVYRLQGDNVEVYPKPDSDVYMLDLWFVPSAPQPTQDASATQIDERFDEYVVTHVVRELLFRDKDWDAYDRAGAKLQEMEAEILILGRSRDINSPPKITRTRQYDRWGRRVR